MNRQMAKVLLLAMVTVTLIAFHGCRGDVSEDPFLTERFRKIEDQLEKLRNVPLEIQELRKDIDALTVKLQEIESTLATLQNRVQTLTTQLATVQKQPAATPSAAATPVPTAPTRTPTTLRTTPPAATPTAPPPRVTPSPVRPTPSPTPSGRYETAQKGDTLQQFADRHGVSVPALIKANRVILMDLQPGDEIPVQQYWIPPQ